MGKRYLIDANAEIDYLDGKIPSAGMKFMDEVVNEMPLVSIITKVEVLGFNAKPESYKMLEDFMRSAIIFPLSDEIADKCIEFRKLRRIKLPDCIIGCTALTHKLILITRNSIDFKGLTGLEIINPYEL